MGGVWAPGRAQRSVGDSAVSLRVGSFRGASASARSAAWNTGFSSFQEPRGGHAQPFTFADTAPRSFCPEGGVCVLAAWALLPPASAPRPCDGGAQAGVTLGPACLSPCPQRSRSSGGGGSRASRGALPPHGPTLLPSPALVPVGGSDLVSSQLPQRLFLLLFSAFLNFFSHTFSLSGGGGSGRESHGL